MEGMNQPQVVAFWIWYKSANGSGKRSFATTAERCGVGADTIRRWHNDHSWETLAAEKDKELGRKIEREVEAEIISDFKLAQARQRKTIAQLYQKFQAAIEKMNWRDFRIADLLKLMEYETQYMFKDEPGVQPQNNLLAVVLQMMPVEARTEFNAAFERARDAGQLQSPPVGFIGRG